MGYKENANFMNFRNLQRISYLFTSDKHNALENGF